MLRKLRHDTAFVPQSGSNADRGLDGRSCACRARTLSGEDIVGNHPIARLWRGPEGLRSVIRNPCLTSESRAPLSRPPRPARLRPNKRPGQCPAGIKSNRPLASPATRHRLITLTLDVRERIVPIKDHPDQISGECACAILNSVDEGDVAPIPPRWVIRLRKPCGINCCADDQNSRTSFAMAVGAIS